MEVIHNNELIMIKRERTMATHGNPKQHTQMCEMTQEIINTMKHKYYKT